MKCEIGQVWEWRNTQRTPLVWSVQITSFKDGCAYGKVMKSSDTSFPPKRETTSTTILAADERGRVYNEDELAGIWTLIEDNKCLVSCAECGNQFDLNTHVHYLCPTCSGVSV